MDTCECETESDTIQELKYNLQLFEDEYELSMKIDKSFLELKLKQKNIIPNYYYIEKLDLQRINNLFRTNFKEINEAFNFLYALIIGNSVILLHNAERNTITNFDYLIN